MKKQFKVLSKRTVHLLCRRCQKRSEEFVASHVRDGLGFEWIEGRPEGWITLEAEFGFTSVIYGICVACNGRQP